MAAKSSRHQYRYGATSRHSRYMWLSMLVMAQVRDWLAQTFTRHTAGGASKHLSSTTPRFRSVANAIRAGILVDRYVSSGLLDKAVKEFKRKAVTSDYSESILKPRLHRDTILSKSSSQTEAKKVAHTRLPSVPSWQNSSARWRASIGIFIGPQSATAVGPTSVLPIGATAAR